MRFYSFFVATTLLIAFSISPSRVQEAHTNVTYPPSKAFMQRHAVPLVQEMVDSEIVKRSIDIQNERYGTLKENEIIGLDNQWRNETKGDVKPLISATLSNPLSANLTRKQAHSVGLFTEIFVMDANGLNVGQSNITSDMWQGDEAKFQKSFGAGHGAIFIDDAEFDDELGIWKAQINMTISNENNIPIGAITAEINATELMRRFAS